MIAKCTAYQNSKFEVTMTPSSSYQHPYLEALREGKFPNMPDALRDLFEQYQGYSRSFQAYLSALMATIENPNDLAMLQENIDEEGGTVHEDEIVQAGLKLEWVQGVPHTELFSRFCHAIGTNPKATILPLVIEWEQSMLGLCGKSMGHGIGALGLGTEALVPTMYTPIWQAIQQTFPNLDPCDSCFFPLHIHCDDDHALQLQKLGEKHPKLTPDILEGRDEALALRHCFWDCMLERAWIMPPSDAAMLYDGQATHWIRTEPTCLSDFTARPKVLQACEPVANRTILDLGCGDGYCTRLLLAQGAASVVGIDISPNMIDAAVGQHTSGALYCTGDATSLKETLDKNAYPIMFDCVVAVFLFNYISNAEMEQVMTQVRHVLKPGGKFVFSVPHPCFPFWVRDSIYPFYFALPEHASYFEMRDALCHGKIWRQDGQELLIQLKHKTMQDYFVAMRKAGFTMMPEVTELHADGDLQKLMPEFVANLKGIPLHICFTVMVPFDDNNNK